MLQIYLNVMIPSWNSGSKQVLVRSTKEVLNIVQFGPEFSSYRTLKFAVKKRSDMLGPRLHFLQVYVKKSLLFGRPRFDFRIIQSLGGYNL